MSMPYHELREVSDEELIELYDEKAKHTVVGIDYYANEIERRQTEKSNKTMVECTKAITIMTGVMLLATIANVVIALTR